MNIFLYIYGFKWENGNKSFHFVPHIHICFSMNVGYYINIFILILKNKKNEKQELKFNKIIDFCRRFIVCLFSVQS